jgi:hypothetical protein
VPTIACPVTCQLHDLEETNPKFRVNHQPDSRTPYNYADGLTHSKSPHSSKKLKVTHDTFVINSGDSYKKHRCYHANLPSGDKQCLCECIDDINFNAGNGAFQAGGQQSAGGQVTSEDVDPQDEFSSFFPNRSDPGQEVQNAPDPTKQAGTMVWTVIGNSNLHPNNTPRLVLDSTRQAVRCCADQAQVFTFNGHARPNWQKNTPCGIYTYVQSGANAGSCLNGATYREAQHFCKSTGGRLCTKTELESSCTAGMGCNFDDEKVSIWSSTTQSYNDNNMYNPYGNHVDIKSRPEVPDLVDFWANRDRAEYDRNVKHVGPGATDAPTN